MWTEKYWLACHEKKMPKEVSLNRSHCLPAVTHPQEFHEVFTSFSPHWGFTKSLLVLIVNILDT